MAAGMVADLPVVEEQRHPIGQHPNHREHYQGHALMDSGMFEVQIKYQFWLSVPENPKRLVFWFQGVEDQIPTSLRCRVVEANVHLVQVSQQSTWHFHRDARKCRREGVVGLESRYVLSSGRDLFEHLFLGGEVCLDVAVRRLDVFMAQPEGNHRDVDRLACCAAGRGAPPKSPPTAGRPPDRIRSIRAPGFVGSPVRSSSHAPCLRKPTGSHRPRCSAWRTGYPASIRARLIPSC